MAGGCVPDEAARQQCQGKAGFTYGPQPYVYCRGVAPNPEEEQQRRERIRNSPCECFDVAAVQKRRDACSRVPSMPPQPSNPR